MYLKYAKSEKKISLAYANFGSVSLCFCYVQPTIDLGLLLKDDDGLSTELADVPEPDQIG